MSTLSTKQLKTILYKLNLEKFDYHFIERGDWIFVDVEDSNEINYMIYTGFVKSKNNEDINDNLKNNITNEVDLNLGYNPVLIYENWNHEQQINSDFTKIIKKDKQFLKQFLSVYLEGIEEINLSVDQNGINYLEYFPEKTSNLSAYIYNISFYEIKKIYNILGRNLFKYNVRYALKSKSTKELYNIFGNYIKKAIYIYFSNKSSSIKPEILEEIESELKEFEKDLYDPQRFWFCHNGITIFSFDKVGTTSNQITLNPGKISVINGAQTITHFFDALEEIKLKIKNSIKDEETKKVEEYVLNNIFVKTIIIKGG